MCQINWTRAIFLSNKLPANLRGWVAVAESSDWFAWPNEKMSRAKKEETYLFMCTGPKAVSSQQGGFKRSFFNRAANSTKLGHSIHYFGSYILFVSFPQGEA